VPDTMFRVQGIMKRPKLFIAMPLMDELEELPHLLDDIQSQADVEFTVYFCVNQPDIWWGG